MCAATPAHDSKTRVIFRPESTSRPASGTAGARIAATLRSQQLDVEPLQHDPLTSTWSQTNLSTNNVAMWNSSGY
ncbi:hypothetical protein ON010_g3623 [Phytophthora cinnamomi]|nr:hypothetical protein ON010_g3623 [Phytophthora cinnamomi]